ncbi:hypothetical protein JR316_0006154 [Psilocybe cubensis]|uniref:Uncharacterized protein n=2 Tax=Psilocybe cubensis TaxID=181762 RepID=A0ACB8H1Q7_PSICU|nr:hypothetical protein JR316_0006154 [Psilocybe cubensis]KAH9481627.1 hypothetical protein JR316_0006154 [Psilocybe cubensis]
MDSKITDAKSLRLALAKLDANVRDAVRSGEVKKVMTDLNGLLKEIFHVKKARIHPEIFKEFGNFVWSVIVDYKKSSKASDFDIAGFVTKHRSALANIEGGSALPASTLPDQHKSDVGGNPDIVSDTSRVKGSDGSDTSRVKGSDGSDTSRIKVSDGSGSAPPPDNSKMSNLESTPTQGRTPTPTNVERRESNSEALSAQHRKGLNIITQTMSVHAERTSTPSNATMRPSNPSSRPANLTPSLPPSAANPIVPPASTSFRSMSTSNPVALPANKANDMTKAQGKPKRTSKGGESTKDNLKPQSVGIFAHEVAMAHFDRPDSPENKFRALKLQKMLKEGPSREPISGSEYQGSSSENEESEEEKAVGKRKRSSKASTPILATKCDWCIKYNTQCDEILDKTGKRACAICNRQKKGCTWGGTLVSESRRAQKAAAQNAKANTNGPTNANTKTLKATRARKAKKSESNQTDSEVMPPKKKVKKSLPYVVDSDVISDGAKSDRESKQKKNKPLDSVDYVEITSGSDTSQSPPKPISKPTPSTTVPPAPSKTMPPAPSTTIPPTHLATIQAPPPPPQRRLQDSDLTDIPLVSDLLNRMNEMEVTTCALQVDLALLRTTNEELQDELTSVKSAHTSLKRRYDDLYERVTQHRKSAADCQSAFALKWGSGMSKIKAEVKYLSDCLERTEDSLVVLEGRVDDIDKLHQMHSDGAYLSWDGESDGNDCPIPMDMSSDEASHSLNAATNNPTNPTIDKPASDTKSDPASDEKSDPASDAKSDPASDKKSDPASDDNSDPASDDDADPASNNNSNAAANANKDTVEDAVKANKSNSDNNPDPMSGGDVFIPPQPPTTPPALPLSPPPAL